MISDFGMKILLSATSICIGAILGIIRSRIFASKSPNTLYYLFYSVSGLTFIGAVYLIIKYNSKLAGFEIITILFALVASIFLFFYSRKFLVFKNVYKSKKLDPIVNDFTSKADKNEINLFGGDLNFLGNEPSQIDSNIQYTKLKSLNFRRVNILCESPNSPTQVIRYGKILTEIKGVEFRFYHPEKADLKVRGRIIKVNGVNRLLMYNRIESGIYQAIETDVANSNGALYNNIWELAWSLAEKPSIEMLESYKQSFIG